MSDFWASQLFGLLAIAFDIIKFTRTKRAHLILWGLPAGWSMVASQYFLGQYQGAAFQVVSSLDSITQSMLGLDNRQHRVLRIIVGILFGSIGFCLYAPTTVWWTWIPVGSYLFAVAGKVFYNTVTIRTVWIASSTCTITYSAICSNWSIVIQQIIVISLTVWFLLKHYGVIHDPRKPV